MPDFVSNFIEQDIQDITATEAQMLRHELEMQEIRAQVRASQTMRPGLGRTRPMNAPTLNSSNFTFAAGGSGGGNRMNTPQQGEHYELRVSHTEAGYTLKMFLGGVEVEAWGEEDADDAQAAAATLVERYTKVRPYETRSVDMRQRSQPRPNTGRGHLTRDQRNRIQQRVLATEGESEDSLEINIDEEAITRAEAVAIPF